MKGVDYSWARPQPSAIKAAGFDFVLRYVPYLGAGGKGITITELHDLISAGLSVGFVFESTAERALAGAVAGAEDAAHCLAMTTAFDLPPDQPYYFAVDFDAQPSQLPAIGEYLRGAASILGAHCVGVYGSYSVVDYCSVNGLANYFWQTLAWSHGALHPYRHIYQYINSQTIGGGSVDFNEALQPDFGQFPSEESMTVEQLNAALQKRMELTRIALEIQRKANDPDLAVVEANITALNNCGYR